MLLIKKYLIYIFQKITSKFNFCKCESSGKMKIISGILFLELYNMVLLCYVIDMSVTNNRVRNNER